MLRRATDGEFQLSLLAVLIAATGVFNSGCERSGDAAHFGDNGSNVESGIAGESGQATVAVDGASGSISVTNSADAPAAVVTENVGSAAPEDGSANLAVSEAAAASDSASAESEVPVKHPEFKKDAKTGALRVSYDDLDLLKVLNVKDVTPDTPQKLPDWLKGLEGKPVRLRGFMHPQSAFQETGIGRFTLCRDTGVCCFGPKPTLYYLVFITMKNGQTTHYIDNRPFDVVGKFHIELVENSGEIVELYHVDDAVVIEK